jgi:uncharacterized protein (DUF2147 family)
MTSRKMILLAALVIPTLLFSIAKVLIDANDIVDTWLNEEGTAKVRIFKATNGKYYGKIIWLKEPNKDGKPKVDDKNPDKTKNNEPIMGLQLLKGFEFDADDKEWNGGTIYDPKNGKTYSCIITKNGDKAIKVRGYIGVSLLGRTTVWTKD